LLLMAAAVAAICVLAGVTLPPRRVMLPSGTDGTVAGVLHIHTNRSDGRSTPDEVAAAAARAGLQFIAFTDHGDATRPPDPPAYRSGVLCLDGVEISTAGGHLIALDMPASPYPLAGEARDVVEDVHRLGGFSIAAHPDSPKRELRWSDWDAPIDGVEWINPDTSWRVLAAGRASRFRLFAGILHYPFRPEETLASLLTGADAAIERWNAIAATRKIVGLAGTDAHANIALRNTDPVETRLAIPLPSYEASFRMLSVHITPDRPFTGDAVADAAVLIRAVRAGHLYMTVDGLASPPVFEMSATNERGTAAPGDELAVGGPLTVRVRTNAPGFTTVLWRNNVMLPPAPAGERAEWSIDSGEVPAVYRAEVRAGDTDRPRSWLLSNAIYLRGPAATTATTATTATGATGATGAAGETASPAGGAALALFDGATEAGWHVETDPSSTAALKIGATASDTNLEVRFMLAATHVGDERAALVWGTPIGHAPVNVADFDRLTFSARSERPMRISVQLRTANVGGMMRRWQRSVYLDASEQPRTVDFRELRPSDGTAEPAAQLDQISQILFVVDTVNTKPGTAGAFWISTPEFRRGGR
jgi:hypothetical protein